MARAEASQATGSSLGPLDGVPVSVKDILDVRGMPTRHGSHLRPDTPKERDSPSVAQLREAGLLDDTGEESLRAELGREINEAFEFARNAPFPELETAGDHVYA